MKLKVSLEQAVAAAAEGFEIECYVVAEKSEPASPGKTGKRGPQIPSDAVFTLSFDGKLPGFGKLLDAWKKIKAELWQDDVTAEYTAEELRAALDHHGVGRGSFGNLVNTYGLVRRVDS